MVNSKQRVVLLVEDSLSSVLLVERSLKQLGSPVWLQITRDGEQGRSYLKGEGEYADRQRYPFPDMVLTNTKMPRMNGMELLIWIKQQPELQNLPIVMMSSSNNPAEREQAIALGISAYFAKPFRLEELVEAIRAVLLLLTANSEMEL